MTDIAELDRRVTALENKQDRTADDIAAIKRDMRKLALIQDDMREATDELNRRVAAVELIVMANARTTEKGFAEVNGRLDRIEADFRQVKGELAALRLDLPGMIGDVMREVLRGSR